MRTVAASRCAILARQSAPPATDFSLSGPKRFVPYGLRGIMAAAVPLPFVRMASRATGGNLAGDQTGFVVGGAKVGNVDDQAAGASDSLDIAG